MKIILLKDVPKVGQKYDVKEVKDGFAANFLFPRRLAKQASKADIEKIEELKKEALEKKREADIKLIEALEKAAETPLQIEAKANEKGVLFAGIGKKEIIESIKEREGIELSRGNIILKDPIKEAGDHEVRIDVEKKRIVLPLVVSAV